MFIPGLLMTVVTGVVVSITNQRMSSVTTLHQILASQTDPGTLRRVLQSPIRSAKEEPTGVETLQMMMKSLPPSSRELQMIIGDSKTNFTTVTDDILNRIDSPKIEIPVDAPLTFDVNKFITSDVGSDDEDVINLDQDYLYEDVDRGRQSTNSAFISKERVHLFHL